MTERLSLLSWILLSVAVVSIGGVAWFAITINDMKAARIEYVEQRRQQSTTESAAERTHSIATQTASDRSALQTLLSTDVVTAANMLKAIGKPTNTNVKLSSVLPEAAPVTPAGGQKLQAVGFALVADGSFNQVMQTLQLLESLPLISSVERLDLTRDDKSGAWRMSVYIRILTTSTISS